MGRDFRILVGLIVLSAMVRLPNLGKEPLWSDEAGAWRTSSLPIVELWNWNHPVDKGNPPLFFTLLASWRHLFGDSEAALRGLSAVASVATVAVVAVIGRGVGGPAVGALAGLLMAIAPFNVRYAQEARPYALMSFAISVAMLAVVRILQTLPAETADTERTPARRHWILLGLASAVALLLHNTAVFPVFGLYLVVGWAWKFRLHRAHAARFAMAAAMSMAITVVLWSMWWPGLWTQLTIVKGGFWIPGPSVNHIAASFYPVYAGSLVRDERTHATWELGAIAVATLFSAAIAAIAFWRWRRDGSTLALMTIVAVLMPALMVAISFWTPILLPRTALWLTIPATVVLASGALAPRSRVVRSALLIGILSLNGYGLWNYHVYFRKEAWRSAAALIAREYREGDVIVFCAGYLENPFDYYFHNSGLRPRRYYVDAATDRAQLVEIGTRAAAGSRIWLVYGHEWLADPKGTVPATLAQISGRLGRTNFYEVRVDLYGAGSSQAAIK